MIKSVGLTAPVWGPHLTEGQVTSTWFCFELGDWAASGTTRGVSPLASFPALLSHRFGFHCGQLFSLLPTCGKAMLTVPPQALKCTAFW